MAFFKNEAKGERRRRKASTARGPPVCHCGYFCPLHVLGRRHSRKYELAGPRWRWGIRLSEVHFRARCYNTEMDCHIRFRSIGYYTLGLRFPARSSTWSDWIPVFFSSCRLSLFLSSLSLFFTLVVAPLKGMTGWHEFLSFSFANALNYPNCKRCTFHQEIRH